MTNTPPEAVACGTHALDTAAFIGLLERQLALYTRLKELSDEQGKTISTGSCESLLTLLSTRRQLVEELGRVNTDLDQYRSDWEAFRATLSDPDRTRVQSLLADVRSSLSHIIEQDRAHSERLVGRRNRVGDELGKVRQGGAAARAYQTTGAPVRQARYTNRQG